MSCHSRQRPHDHERVKKFMKVKRHKAMADRKVKDQEAKKKKAQVQERLLALEAYRKTQVLETVNNIFNGFAFLSLHL